MKRLSALTVGIVTVAGSAGAALAAWTIGSIDASGRGAARTLPAGPLPTATASGPNVTIAFAQVAVGETAVGALPGGGYTVKRYTPGGVAQIVLGSCGETVRGSAPMLSCVENDVASGTWIYRVTPILAGWRGAESVAAPAVTVDVDTTPPIIALTSFGPAQGLGNTKVTAAGTASPTDGNVTVYVCRTALCTAANTVVSPGSVSVVDGLWTYTSPNLGSGSHYAVAHQTDAAGNTGTSNTAGPVTR